ncbi:hypothetical protein K440DRAFT_273938 [Wilcoxina mikolae CBS 423.85]|nr:hypothetical protein K440DRAFT_273938 [Wilcoxina mikolae CBS 423.85]
MIMNVDDKVLEAHSVGEPVANPSPTATAPSDEHLQRPQRTQSLSVTVPRIQTAHARAASVATSSPAGRKRLSLSFPVLPPGYDPPPRNHSPATPSSSSVGLTTPPNGDVSPEDSASFLTILAAQERRVLELREELSKAESELTKLKRQWANHEANKSRYEVHNSGVTTPQRTGRDMRDAMTSPTNREEFQRRQQRGVTGSSSRKVLPSQRHQRTLSLLSPDREFRQSFPRPKDLDSDSASAISKKRASLNAKESSSTSLSARAQSLDLPDRPKSQDLFIKTGQQIAADFRDGLWTFLEDLKQATVGEDTPRAPTPNTTTATTSRPNTVRRISSKANLRSSSTEKLNGTSLERRHSKENRKSSRKGKLPETEESLIDFSQDNDQLQSRDDRDPSFRWSSSTLSDYPDPSGIMTPPSRASTPRTSTRLVSLRTHDFILNVARKSKENSAENKILAPSPLSTSPRPIQPHKPPLGAL